MNGAISSIDCFMCVLLFPLFVPLVSRTTCSTAAGLEALSPSEKQQAITDAEGFVSFVTLPGFPIYRLVVYVVHAVLEPSNSLLGVHM